MAVNIAQWDLRCEKCGDGQKIYNGCEEESDIAEQRFGVRRCPIKLITQVTNSFLIAYGYLQKGILPYQFGYLKNSNRYVEAMQIIDREVKKLEAETVKQIKVQR